MTTEVLELSVEETNALRAKLGLAPLRGVTAPSHVESSNEVLELSVDDTNALRVKLGLAPLRTASEGEQDGSSSRQAVHRPANNEGDAKLVQARLETARLKREVQRGIATTFASHTLADDEDKGDSGNNNALSWAAKMRSIGTDQVKPTKTKKSEKQRDKDIALSYGEKDLHGIAVSHALSELEAGSTTILTLADAPLLKTNSESSKKVVGLNDEMDQTLENVELTQRHLQQDGLQKKRQVELGMGRAGGYAGFDDDEFEEMGGSQGPSQFSRGLVAGDSGFQDKTRNRLGFRIGADIEEDNVSGGGKGSDLFAFHDGRAISLESGQVDLTASDFMTAEEDEATRKSKKQKKDTKFKKKKTKSKEKKHRRQRDNDEDEEPSPKGLLEELEETAVEVPTEGGRKRRRTGSDDDTQMESGETGTSATAETSAQDDVDEAAKKRAKFDAIMAKSNARTALAFEEAKPEIIMDDEPDDAFLNAALAKARRLRRLREMSEKTQTRGADAVAEAIQQSRQIQNVEVVPDNDTLTFAIDDTREFTRALRARAEQVERQQARKVQAAVNKGHSVTTTAKATVVETVQDSDELEASLPEDMEELAKEIQDDGGNNAAAGFDGTTASQISVGRGLSNVLSMLRHTGEITGKNAGKEELRGRAKDKRTYEDYESLDLARVVKIDKNANEKDKEFALREIKLEYRDEHGRLLTRKEAYRNLCYQFHGHGSSKKNEERRLRQIAREQAEARLASRAVTEGSGPAAGSLGALKATQRATGKAFIVHKT